MCFKFHGKRRSEREKFLCATVINNGVQGFTCNFLSAVDITEEENKNRDEKDKKTREDGERIRFSFIKKNSAGYKMQVFLLYWV